MCANFGDCRSSDRELKQNKKTEKNNHFSVESLLIRLFA